jgi:hypothetical protein
MSAAAQDRLCGFRTVIEPIMRASKARCRAEAFGPIQT